ncbi:MAG: ABC transporter ATP-binding protein [Magnetovibrio sp.]|nr:ABC transporter ATP-binding protein [Magnetovibrio sp.]
MSFLTVQNLSKSFGGNRAVDDVSFTLGKGELLALIGPNGAGKSTCFNMLYGILAPDKGSVCLDGRELIGMKPRDIWRLGVGRTFQITAVYASMSVVENVQMALISHNRKAFSAFTGAAKLYRDDAMALLDLIGMKDQADRAANILAYGDLKRLELAVALAHDPVLLLMDEPTAGMAPGERRALMKLTADIVAKRGVSVLFTEHDMDVVFENAHRVLVLNRGQLLAEGSVDDVRANPAVQEVYLGGGTTFGGDGDHA